MRSMKDTSDGFSPKHYSSLGGKTVPSLHTASLGSGSVGWFAGGL